MTGVIGHVPNPTPAQAVDMATAAEAGGAAWLGLADAFWWRDVYMLLTHAAQATDRLALGPAMTNPYLRHPFHTVSALATLQELAPGRVFCGIAAGGSEVTVAAGIERTDAAARAEGLARTLRSVVRGGPLDPTSGRGLDVAFSSDVPILMAGRGNAMLTMAGRTADRVLLWAIPQSDLERSAARIRAGADEAGRTVELCWAPLVAHPGISEASIGHAAVYAALNTHNDLRLRWGLTADGVEAIRAALVAGNTSQAIALVPSPAWDELVWSETASEDIAHTANHLGVTELAVPGFSLDTLEHQLQWAATVEQRLGH